MNQRDTSGVATPFVALLQDLERAAEQVIADLSKGDRSLADFTQLVGAVKRLARPVGFEREEFRHSHRDAIQDALERADRGIHLVGLDERDRRVGHPGALGKLTLGEFVAAADEAQPVADIDAHRRPKVQDLAVYGVADRTNGINWV